MPFSETDIPTSVELIFVDIVHTDQDSQNVHFLRTCKQKLPTNQDDAFTSCPGEVIPDGKAGA